MVTCKDNAADVTGKQNDTLCDIHGFHSTVVDDDAEPVELATWLENLVVQKTTGFLVNSEMLDLQPNMWPEMWSDMPASDLSRLMINTLIYVYSPFTDFKTGGTFFVSSLMNGTTTGVPHAVTCDISMGRQDRNCVPIIDAMGYRSPFCGYPGPQRLPAS